MNSCNLGRVLQKLSHSRVGIVPEEHRNSETLGLCPTIYPPLLEFGHPRQPMCQNEEGPCIANQQEALKVAREDSNKIDQLVERVDAYLQTPEK